MSKSLLTATLLLVAQEIVAIMNTAVKDKASAKKKEGYIAYGRGLWSGFGCT